MFYMYFDKTKELEEKLGVLKRENEDKKLKIITLENEKKYLNSQIKIIKTENERLVKILQNLGNNNEEIINQLTILGMKENNSDSMNNIKIDQKTGEIVGNEKLQNIVSIDFYDVIACINSIKDITKGWEIKMSQNAIKQYDSFKKDKVLKIGVIGNSNKGKSFILSKISKIDLPSGTSIRTEGLSIKYPDTKLYQKRNIALLDSAGLETPVLKDIMKEEIEKIKEKEKKEDNNKDNKDQKDNEEKEEIKEEKVENEMNQEEQIIDDKKMEEKNQIKDNENEKENDKGDNNFNNNKSEMFKEKAREKLITEMFLQSYILHNSDIILVIVGNLTFSEQKLINRIKREIKKYKINKSLFIIHNLKTYTHVQQVEEYINDYLLKSATFDLEKQDNISTKIKTKTGVSYYEKNTNPKVFHLIYANEKSEAGDYYNNFTLKFIENNFQNITDLTPFDVIETIKKRFKDISNDVLEKNTDKLEFNNSNKLIKLQKPKNIKLKKCLIDELGFSNLKPNGYEPTYNYYKKDDKIIIRVEIPGNNKIDSKIDYLGEYSVIILKGIKKKDKEPKLEDNIYNSREFGDFELNIYLKTDEYFLKNEKPKINQKNGIVFLEYNLGEKNNETGAETKEDDEI